MRIHHNSIEQHLTYKTTFSLRSGPGRIATLGNMGQSSGGGRPQSRDDDSDDEDEDDNGKRETWFAGGEKR